MFFEPEREHFFSPLTGKYREVCVQCLALLYRHLYTELRDYASRLDRAQLLDVFKEAIARAPVLDEDADDPEGRFKNPHELAGFILNRLLEAGWLEKQVDEASLQSSYHFTRTGRLFTGPLVSDRSGQWRTRNRNTRNTRNCLKAFLENGEIHDLLDAYEYSERIISDFTDTIAELDDRKRQLVREVQARQLVEQATDEFFEFMETVFKPDLQVRLSADSVEKYRDQIDKLMARIRRKRPYGGSDPATREMDWRAVMEKRLREALPAQVVPGQSIMNNLLEAIETRLKNACDVMLPALRGALDGFTQRADIIIRQLSYLHREGGDDLPGLCRRLQALPHEQQDQALADQARLLDGMRLKFIDPGQIKLHSRAAPSRLHSEVDEGGALDKQAQKQLQVEQALARAFDVQPRELRRYLAERLVAGQSLSSAELRAESVPELLNLTHAIEVAADAGGPRFRVEQTPQSLHRPPAVTDDPLFVARDAFTLSLPEETNE